MRTMASILSLSYTGNFFRKTNADGFNLDLGSHESLRWVIGNETQKAIHHAGGFVRNRANHLEVWAPYRQTSTGPEMKAPLPARFTFYLCSSGPQAIRFSGLDFGRKRLVAKPTAHTGLYTLNGVQKPFRNLGASTALIGKADILPVIHPLLNDAVIKSWPVSQEISLAPAQLEWNAVVYHVGRANDLQALEKELEKRLFESAAVSLKRKFAPGDVTENLTVYILPAEMPVHALVAVVIESSALEFGFTAASQQYKENNFVLHFPAPPAKLKVSLLTSRTPTGNKATFNGKSANLAPAASPAELPAGYKALAATFNTGPFYLDDPNVFSIVESNKTYSAGIDPFGHYDQETQTALANITIPLLNQKT